MCFSDDDDDDDDDRCVSVMMMMMMMLTGVPLWTSKSVISSNLAFLARNYNYPGGEITLQMIENIYKGTE